MYCKLHDSFKHNFEDCDMFRQIVKSAIDNGRLKLVKIPKDDHAIPIGPDGKNFCIGCFKPIHLKIRR